MSLKVDLDTIASFLETCKGPVSDPEVLQRAHRNLTATFKEIITELPHAICRQKETLASLWDQVSAVLSDANAFPKHLQELQRRIQRLTCIYLINYSEQTGYFNNGGRAQTLWPPILTFLKDKKPDNAKKAANEIADPGLKTDVQHCMYSIFYYQIVDPLAASALLPKLEGNLSRDLAILRDDELARAQALLDLGKLDEAFDYILMMRNPFEKEQFLNTLTLEYIKRSLWEKATDVSLFITDDELKSNLLQQVQEGALSEGQIAEALAATNEVPFRVFRASLHIEIVGKLAELGRIDDAKAVIPYLPKGEEWKSALAARLKMVNIPADRLNELLNTNGKKS